MTFDTETFTLCHGMINLAAVVLGKIDGIDFGENGIKILNVQPIRNLRLEGPDD